VATGTPSRGTARRGPDRPSVGAAVVANAEGADGRPTAPSAFSGSASLPLWSEKCTGYANIREFNINIGYPHNY
jgi:hypothetical protein